MPTAAQDKLDAIAGGYYGTPFDVLRSHPQDDHRGWVVRTFQPQAASAAVKRVQQRQGVWQVNGGKTSFKPVKIGAQTLDGESQVLEGLKPGEQVIVHSSAQLQEGTKVKLGKAS